MNAPLRPSQSGLHSPDYMSGFGNGFETEALPGALPQGRNSPQKCAYGLYAEQLSGSPFTAPRASNQRSWLYRIQPSVKHMGEYRAADTRLWLTAPCGVSSLPIAPLRWSALPLPAAGQTLVEGMNTITVAGDANARSGMAAHVYLATSSMDDAYFYNAEGEMLFVLQQGALRFRTEFGVLDAGPGDIVVIPRGVKFAADLKGQSARGYVCENYGGVFTLPERGPIGANCLANPRDFKSPVAAYEDREAACTLTVKWGGTFYATELRHSPLDVVAWHGNYAPYKYDLRTFSPVGPLLFDHADPSIFTVLTAPTSSPGTANVDFVIFPDRWMVAENTFRPPWYHMNLMSEFMGLIYGAYDAKPQGFEPGGFSLHNCMLPHGPDAEAFKGASEAVLAPRKLEGTMAFMFETYLPQLVTNYAADLPERQHAYATCWQDLKRSFNPANRNQGGLGEPA
jgi:homogentisate 1,2-dioxygenase